MPATPSYSPTPSAGFGVKVTLSDTTYPLRAASRHASVELAGRLFLMEPGAVARSLYPRAHLTRTRSANLRRMSAGPRGRPGIGMAAIYRPIKPIARSGEWDTGRQYSLKGQGAVLKRPEENGAPGTIRTSDPQIRSLMLYPAELRARTALRRGREN